ncbi:DUF3888 domain-containing protein [Paenibacillus chibensis]|uniref:DUF3888 domain-containing protein n=1 Tax=Paenibacillus chibensis TaxID=59846 RepID=A0ABU6PPC0_9BACL|nr:DUF3888 domain-containing protein [Paenibacillus chibensis]
MKTRMRLFLSMLSMLIFAVPVTAAAAEAAPKEPKLLLYQDIMMELLLPDIQNAVNDYYKSKLTENPLVYPYQIDIVQAKRVNGGPGDRGFHFSITLETTPVLGPHVSVGKDRMTFEISPLFPDKIQLVAFHHLQTFELPPNMQDLLKRSEEPSGSSPEKTDQNSPVSGFQPTRP